ncbi:MAG TPA: cytidine deaminase [Bacillota bacterium]
MKNNELLTQAIRAKKQAYAPYSKFPVGAALLTTSGKIYTGCNIENASYSLTCCAERIAIFKAIAAGERNFTEMAVVANSKRPVPPCGACRQVMSEFFEPTMVIYLANAQHQLITMTMEDLLPFSFDASDVTK